MGVLITFGKYVILIFRVFSKPEKTKIYLKQTVREIENLGVIQSE